MRSPLGPHARRLVARHGLRVVVGLAALGLGVRTARAVFERVGGPGAALDDAYIHFQYARAIAEGHPFRFQAGEPPSTGGTSVLWPLVLAPFWAAGLRGDRLVLAAWALSFAALAALALEAAALVRPLASREGAAAAAGLVLAFAGFTWGAGSGMEIVPFAWAFAATVRRAADVAEAREGPGALAPRAPDALVAFAWAAPLIRPEGALASVAAAAALVVGRRAIGARRAAGLAALALTGAFAPTLVNLALTGHAASDTADVKLLVTQPYVEPYGSWGVRAFEHARLLVGTILDGEAWGAEYLPRGLAGVGVAGLVAVAVRAHLAGRRARGALVLGLALALFVPCLYLTFLWNRLRYLLPFATGWLLGVVCLGHVLADAGARLGLGRARALLRLGVPFAAAGLFAAKLDGVVEDVAQSASGIHRQQVTLGRWVRTALPPDARVGVNDTGAIAYFGERRTFDVVGLTTPGEGRFWKAGPASRFEHYERLVREGRAFPTHFAVYPEWMAIPPLLGVARAEAVVLDATILGGTTMRVHEARREILGSGEVPLAGCTLRDALDVADLDDERAHAYDAEGAREGEQVVLEVLGPRGPVADGGRTSRRRDRFALDVGPAGVTTLVTLVARVSAQAEATLRAEVPGADSVETRVTATGAANFVDAALPPARTSGGRVQVTLTGSSAYGLFHVFACAEDAAGATTAAPPR